MSVVRTKNQGVKQLCLEISINGYFAGKRLLERNSETLLFFLGVFLLHQGLTEVAYAGYGSYGMACGGILSLVEGTFGALVTSIAGIGAIVASAMGGFKMAWSLIVVAVGSFILRSYITLFNGNCVNYSAGIGIGINAGGVNIGVGL